MSVLTALSPRQGPSPRGRAALGTTDLRQRGAPGLLACAVSIAAVLFNVACSSPPPPLATAGGVDGAPRASASSGAAISPGASSSPARAASPAASLGQVTASYSSMTAGVLPVIFAQDQGLFASNGLAVDLQYIAATTYMAALLSGQTPIALGGGSEVLSAAAGGSDVVVVAVLQPVYPYQFYVDATIQTAEDLKGKKVGISAIGGTADVASRVALRRLGLDPDHDVVMTVVGSQSNQTAAALSGAVQAEITQPPDSLELAARGWHSLLDMAALKLPTSGLAIVTQKSYIASHRPVVQAYVDSLMQAIAQAKQDRATTLQVLSSFTGITDPAALNATYDLYVNEIEPLVPDPSPSLFGDAVDQISATQPEAKDVDINSIVDESFVQDAARRGIGASDSH